MRAGQAEPARDRRRENAPRVVVGGHHAINSLALTRRHGAFDEVERIELFGMLADIGSAGQYTATAGPFNARQFSLVPHGGTDQEDGFYGGGGRSSGLQVALMSASWSRRRHIGPLMLSRSIHLINTP